MILPERVLGRVSTKVALSGQADGGRLGYRRVADQGALNLGERPSLHRHRLQ